MMTTRVWAGMTGIGDAGLDAERSVAIATECHIMPQIATPDRTDAPASRRTSRCSRAQGWIYEGVGFCPVAKRVGIAAYFRRSARATTTVMPFASSPRLTDGRGAASVISVR